ncbi:MAG TPA: hypothetical protein VF008_28445 [Niastella sp.]
MKNILWFLLVTSFCTGRLQAQEAADSNSIKLFVDQEELAKANPEHSYNLRQRLQTRITQLINQTGVAEIGYSNFIVTPRFDVLSTSLDESGIARLYLAECELSITISRRAYGGHGGAAYQSFSKKLMGSSSKKEDAIANAINSLSYRDNGIVEFFKQAKVKIDKYFKTNCNEIIKEAQQAYDLKEFGKSIALYFSIPSTAPCYEEARNRSIGVYMRFVEDQCDKQLLQLKAVLSVAKTTDTVSSARYYKEALEIMKNMNPASTKCYSEAKILIEKIENRFDEQQKHEWAEESRKNANEAQVQKEMFRAMGRINSNYQPAQATPTVIIAK